MLIKGCDSVFYDRLLCEFSLRDIVFYKHYTERCLVFVLKLIQSSGQITLEALVICY